MSCRASADYLKSLLTGLGLVDKDSIDDETMENLGITEHLRWCAFHYCMGFAPMTDTEFDSRVREYQHQLAQYGSASIRISKNMAQRTHACLVSWDELDTLSRKENAITGKNQDYKDLDRANVRAIPKMLEMSKE